MRPIERQQLVHLAFALSGETLMRELFGPYCSFCERLIRENGWLWLKDRFEVLGVEAEAAAIDPEPIYISGGRWKSTLLLCRECKNAAQSHSADEHPAMLYPDDGLTFFVGERTSSESPFKYEEREIEVDELDAQGQYGTSTLEKLVLIVGTTDSARATIDFFQLNGSYDEKSEHYVYGYTDRMTLADRRVRQRTEVYRDAVAEIEAFGLSGGNVALARNRIRRLIATTGFWSIWATAIWNGTRNPDLIRSLLYPEDTSPLNFPRSPRNLFPGTLNEIVQ